VPRRLRPDHLGAAARAGRVGGRPGRAAPFGRWWQRGNGHRPDASRAGGRVARAVHL